MHAGAVLSLLGVGCSAKPAKLADGSPRFAVVDQTLVRDDRTGLVWSRNANLADIGDPWGGLTWAQASAFVAAMNEGGGPAGDCAAWRLPTAAELDELLAAFIASSSVLVAEIASRDIDRVDWLRNQTTPFTGFAETAYWSSTEAWRATPRDAARDDPFEYALAVDTSGTVLTLPKTATKRIWPVCSARRAGAATAETG